MPRFQHLVRLAAVMSAIAFFSLVAGCSKPAETSSAGSSRVPAQSQPAEPAKAASKLGDLKAFRSIAAEVSAMVEKGDLGAAKSRIKALELEWDAAEAGLKPREAEDWHVVDKAIDQALSALRADPPNQADSQKALSALLKTFDSLQGNI